jgi:hypothetical protein
MSLKSRPPGGLKFSSILILQELFMELKYESYAFTPILGWSISRYEVFDKCKRQYFYSYYSKFVEGVPVYKINKLKELTSVPLEIGNVVHDCIEAFLRRLQKSDSSIDEKRFFEYARSLARKYFSEKTFMETYYGAIDKIDMDRVFEKIDKCLNNFINGPLYSWIYMVAIRDKSNWMIEPAGYGETRLDGLKAYCKMDFLLPVGDEIHILDWKTGGKDEVKHSSQLLGYAAATNHNFNIPLKNIYPKIVYLHPSYDELQVDCAKHDFSSLYNTIRQQTSLMYSYCENSEKNVPKSIDSFPASPSPSLCRQCKFQELCFPERMNPVKFEETGFCEM